MIDSEVKRGMDSGIMEERLVRKEGRKGWRGWYSGWTCSKERVRWRMD